MKIDSSGVLVDLNCAPSLIAFADCSENLRRVADVELWGLSGGTSNARSAIRPSLAEEDGSHERPRTTRIVWGSTLTAHRPGGEMCLAPAWDVGEDALWWALVLSQSRPYP